MGGPKPTMGYATRTAAVSALRAEGRSTGQIATAIGIAPSTVSALERSSRRDRRCEGDRRANPPTRRLDAGQLAKMAELRERGWSCARIAEYFTDAGTKISASSIEWQCMRLGADAPLHLRGQSHPATVPYRRNGVLVRPWTPADDAVLLSLEASGLGPHAIAIRMGRGNSSVRGRLMTLARRDARAEDRH